jgi:hypothetical protein
MSGGAPIVALDDLIARIGDLDWSWAASAHASVQTILKGVHDVPSLLEGHAPGTPERLQESAEKSTHFKWFLARDEAGRFEVSVNVYKPTDRRRVGHASVPHNHRYWFSSLLLRGGFRSQFYDPPTEPGATPLPTSALDLRAGDAFVVDPDAIHALTEIQDGTASLIVQSRPVRSYSIVYEDGAAVRYGDLATERAKWVDEITDYPGLS